MSRKSKKQDPKPAAKKAELSEEALEKTSGGLRMTPLSLGRITRNVAANTIGGSAVPFKPDGTKGRPG